MLQNLFGAQLDLPVRIVIALLVIGVLLGLTVFLVRRLGRDGRSGASRSRQARLAVLDSVTIDSRRRLVLVRRDEVEHLLLVGGSTDIVVEPAISRGSAREPTMAREVPREALREVLPTREAPPRESLPLREAREALPPREQREALSVRESRDALPPRESPYAREAMPPREPVAARRPLGAPTSSTRPSAERASAERTGTDRAGTDRPVLETTGVEKPAADKLADHPPAAPLTPRPASPEEMPAAARVTGVETETAAPVLAPEAAPPAIDPRRPVPVRRMDPAAETARRAEPPAPRAPFVRPPRVESRVEPVRAAIPAVEVAPAASNAVPDVVAQSPTANEPQMVVPLVAEPAAPEIAAVAAPPVSAEAAAITPPAPPTARPEPQQPRRGTTFALGKSEPVAVGQRTEPRLTEAPLRRPAPSAPPVEPPAAAPARSAEIIPALTLEDLLGPDAVEGPPAETLVGGDHAEIFPAADPIAEATPPRRGIGALFRTANVKPRPEADISAPRQDATTSSPLAGEEIATNVVAPPPAARVVEPTNESPEREMPTTAPQVQARPSNPQSLKFDPPTQPKAVPQRAAPSVPPQVPPPEAAQPARRWVLPRATPPVAPAAPATVPADVFAQEPSNPFALDSDAMVMIEPPAAAAEAKATPPAEAEKDPFEDLEAEMASLLGRGAPR